MLEAKVINDTVQVDSLGSAERARSKFVRDMVQRPHDSTPASKAWSTPTPRRIVQFWNDLDRLPEDVKACMDSWKQLKQIGFEIEVFDESSARTFIRNRLGARHESAFDKCYHPSMMSDYFRYSYVLVEGGFYIDADDVYHGTPIEQLFADGRLKLQPFCYDIATSQMVAPPLFTEPGANQPGWIFYFNTTPLIASPGHPIVERALLNATRSLEANLASGLPEVQATTGPGNLTRSVFEVLNEGCSPDALMVAHDWELTSTSQWPLSYRNDSRNWRLSNQRAYRASSLSDAL
ncbi:glycosyltransferase [Variovorax sp. J31P179]|uniref:glycosyltransferase family 32 protein n=1 Tax=Variovorax sp. J31P179 TaxID=3053508 RepID=UPI0025789930|nr:glycosyltransferase [Variovorax sp. J31P179]MDM0081705.1 glycosyltransferase [Variovorax sp. J31P179]